MSDEYGREERHHHRHHERENEDQYDAPPPRRQSEYEGEQGGYGDRPPRRDEGGYSEGGYSEGAYGGGRPVAETTAYQQTYETDQGLATSRVEVTKHKREEEVAGFGGLVAGAAALYEGHEAKKDPANAHRHKLEEEALGTGAVGAEGFALYERHEKKNSRGQVDGYEEKIEEETGHGEKKHGWF